MEKSVSADVCVASFSLVLKAYKEKIEKFFVEKMSLFGKQSKLRDACQYALLNGGKRLRPALVFMVAESLGKGQDVSWAAMAIECFHSASLVADDLPCMDNDDMRRNKPALHKVYGEAMTLLTSYGLIAAGYECLAKNAQLVEGGTEVCALALENASYNTGLLGATGGQFLDLFPPNTSEETVREVIHKKTTSLFEISFVLGWLFGGGDPTQLEAIKKIASHLGIAFQISDDIDDFNQDGEHVGGVNYARIFGVEAAEKVFHVETQAFRNTLQQQGLFNEEWEFLILALEQRSL